MFTSPVFTSSNFDHVGSRENLHCMKNLCGQIWKSASQKEVNVVDMGKHEKLVLSEPCSNDT